MNTDLPYWPALPALMALLPAVLSWWSGRGLAALVDDPMLPERLHASRRHHGVIFVVSLIGLGVLALDSLLWAAPLMLVGTLAAAYPLRKVLYHETWSLGAYLSFFARLLLMSLAFWVALAALPSIAMLGGTLDWLVGLVLGSLLVAVNVRFADVVRVCLRTQPLEEGPLLTRCRALADQCGLPSTRFERVDVNGGVVANALALPSLRGSSSLFSSTLLERLDEDEVVAICAHELAHLEHFDARRLRKLNLTTYALITLAVVCAPISRLAGLWSVLPVLAIWLVILATTLVLRAKDKQRQETAADVRAIGLTGQPEALVTALTKLYSIARIPRRIEQQRERSDSHPSLSRRIRDIRKAAGNTPATLATTSTFSSPDGRTVVRFAEAAVEWADSDVVTHRLHYAGLTEMRIDARGSSSPRLVVRGAEPGSRWEMSLAPHDVAAAQALLDVVDARLGETLPPRAIPFPFHRTVVAFAMALAFLGGQLAVAFVALLALVRPAPQLLLASGLAALTAAGLMVRNLQEASPSSASVAVFVGIVGSVVLWIAHRNRHDVGVDARWGVMALAIAAGLASAAVLRNGIDVVRLHQSAITAIAAPVLLVSLAGALAAFLTTRARVGSGAAALAAAWTVIIGSPAFLDTFARDPFLVATRPVEWVRAGPADMLEEFDVPSATTRLLFSPDGRHIAVLQQIDSEDEETSTFQVGRPGETLSPLVAEDLVFADNDHLLVVTSDAGGTLLKQVPLTAFDEVIWRQYLADVHGASLSFDPATSRWTVIGWSRRREITRTAGTVGSPAIEQRQWPALHTQRVWNVSGVATSGRNALVVEGRYDRGITDGLVSPGWSWWLMAWPYTRESRYWTVGDHGHTDLGASRVGADCQAGSAAGGALVCAAYDGSRTRVFTIDAVTGAIAPVAYLEGQFASDHNAARGWLTGWVGSRPVAIQVATGKAFLPPVGTTMVTRFAPSDGRLAVVMFGQASSRVRTYTIE